MSRNWSGCKNILCIRPDNMGDLLMTTPALRALKESFGCRITVLTSSMAAGIAKHIPEIDDVIVYDVPWVKSSGKADKNFFDVVEKIRMQAFDAAIIFTVYSQNPMPSIMLSYLAGIPRRLAYCRENPYQLLTDWIPDQEPYTLIQHQVKRDLALVEQIGATTDNKCLSLQTDKKQYAPLKEKLTTTDINPNRLWMIFHAGVSEEKRQYPEIYWIELAKKVRDEFGCQILFTGSQSEKSLTERLATATGAMAFSLAGKLSLEEFMLLIEDAPLVISVNTGTIHLCAALGTPQIVLYALTNPQHLPWRAKGCVLTYEIPKEQRSKNEVVRFVHEQMQQQNAPVVMPEDILKAVREILVRNAPYIPEVIVTRPTLHNIR